MAKMAILALLSKMTILVKIDKIDQNTSENFEDRTLRFQSPQTRSKIAQNDEICHFPPKLSKLTISDQNLTKPGQFDTVLSLQPSSDPP